MENSYFSGGAVVVGGEQVSFAQVTVQQRFRVWIPLSFRENTNMGYRYTYLSNEEKSPLGIAFRFMPVEREDMKRKVIDNYFGGAAVQVEQGGSFPLHHRELVSAGVYMSIFTMRFAVEMADGLMLGCFNCAAEYEQHWKEPVLEMLKCIEPAL